MPALYKILLCTLFYLSFINITGVAGQQTDSLVNTLPPRVIYIRKQQDTIFRRANPDLGMCIRQRTLGLNIGLQRFDNTVLELGVNADLDEIFANGYPRPDYVELSLEIRPGRKGSGLHFGALYHIWNVGRHQDKYHFLSAGARLNGYHNPNGNILGLRPMLALSLPFGEWGDNFYFFYGYNFTFLGSESNFGADPFNIPHVIGVVLH